MTLNGSKIFLLYLYDKYDVNVREKNSALVWLIYAEMFFIEFHHFMKFYEKGIGTSEN